MAGPGAVIKVDSFEGGALPPKAQIRSIRISRDQFAAENHAAGGIVDRDHHAAWPRADPLQRRPAVPRRLAERAQPVHADRGPEQQRNFFLGLNGTLIKNKSSFNIFVNGATRTRRRTSTSSDADRHPIGGAAPAHAARQRQRQRQRRLRADARSDAALRLQQQPSRRREPRHRRVRRGGARVLDREHVSTTSACSTSARSAAARSCARGCRSAGPTPSRAPRSRRRPSASTTRSRAAARRSAAGSTRAAFTFGSDLDYVRGIHSLPHRPRRSTRGSVRADDTSNYLGTYTFESLEAFDAGRPRSYTRRIGDPDMRYDNFQARVLRAGRHRVRRNLTLSAGVRYEAQTHVRRLRQRDAARRRHLGAVHERARRRCDRAGASSTTGCRRTPTSRRCASTASGSRSSTSSIRRIPSPAVGDVGVTPPVNRYLLGDGLRLPRSTRVSVGIDQRLAPAGPDERDLRLPARRRVASRPQSQRAGERRAARSALRQHRSRSCPTPASRQHQLQTRRDRQSGRAAARRSSAPLINWKRTTVFVNYTLGVHENNTDGAVQHPGDRPARDRVGAGRATTSGTGSTSRSTTRSSGTC